ncbi:MAG TPA: NAD-dependent epimerase/dehydratase family protein [Candidatus Bilamarchaeaceae archaeon]|nr:NAD-dependent epimerase/dehydratase family protein [Candidatus Bilamarchaeaceae archaeon]
MVSVVTGGAGFIGSHIVDHLLHSGKKVVVLDNLSSGLMENLDKKAGFVKMDLVKDGIEPHLKDCDAVFHIAADPEVRTSAQNPVSGFENNVIATFRLLEACRKADVNNVVFSSTSAVQGDATKIPTPEDFYCEPISNYGASKLSCEAYLSSYAKCYGMKSTVLRFANIYGPRGRHGVLFDFYSKLKKNPKKLEILGDGGQRKSYIHVTDCVLGIMAAKEAQKRAFEIYNIGSRSQMSVKEIATFVSGEMGLSPKFEFAGGERGWVGDVRSMFLDPSKLEKTGWKPKISFEEGLKGYFAWLKTNVTP